MATLTLESPLPLRFLAWMNERFPFSHGILFFVLYATAVIAGRMSVSSETIEFGVHELLGFAPAWCFFFMLRVFDEHKDFESDCQNYPDRVLQSGLINLGHLKVAGGLAILTQFVGSIALDGGFGPVTIWWLVTFGYSLLMFKEFFIGEWLGKRLGLYAVSHMIVMPIALLWMCQIGAGNTPVPLNLGLLAALSFLSGGAFEVTRKMRAPSEERDEIQSYTQIMGTGGAPVFVFIVLLASACVQVALLQWIFDGDVAWWWYALLGGGIVPAAITLTMFRQGPTEKTRKATEPAVSVAMLLSYLVVVGAIIVDRGVTWA